MEIWGLQRVIHCEFSSGIFFSNVDNISDKDEREVFSLEGGDRANETVL